MTSRWRHFKINMTHGCLGRSGGAIVLGKLACQCVPLIWIIVGQEPIALAVGAGRGCLYIFFSRQSFLFSFSLSRRRSDIHWNIFSKGCWTQNNQQTSHSCYGNTLMTSLVKELSRQCMTCSINFSMTLQTEILSVVMSNVLKHWLFSSHLIPCFKSFGDYKLLNCLLIWVL